MYKITCSILHTLCSSNDYLRDLNGGSDRCSRCCVSVGGGCCKSHYSKKYVKYLLQ